MEDDPEDQYEEIGDVTNDLIDDDSDRELSEDEDEVETAVSEVVDARVRVETTAYETLIVDPSKWSTVPYLTENEFASILAKRTTMLQTSNDACIDEIEGKSPKEIALEEIRMRCCPFAVKRKASERPPTYDFIPVNFLLLNDESMTWLDDM